MERSKGTIEEQKRRTFAKLNTRDLKHVIAQCAEAVRMQSTAQTPSSLREAA